MNRIWHFRRLSDGTLAGQFSGTADLLSANTPAGYEAVEGALPAAEHVMTEDAARSMALARRDAELAASDWIAIKALEQGTPVPTVWLTYRQALRDVPQQTGFPASITWPIAPLGRNLS